MVVIIIIIHHTVALSDGYYDYHILSNEISWKDYYKTSSEVLCLLKFLPHIK